MKTNEKIVNGLAKDYAENCDNESGGFLSHQLIAIREKAFKAGYWAKDDREFLQSVSPDRILKLVSALDRCREFVELQITLADVQDRAFDKAIFEKVLKEVFGE